MDDFLTIGSSHRETLNIAPVAKKDEPAVSPILINPAVGLREGVTEGVSRAVLMNWIAANSKHPALTGGLLRNLATGEILSPKAAGSKSGGDQSGAA